MTADTKTLRFGICGMGLMGRGYFRILQDIPGVRVTAICDIAPSRREPSWYGAVNKGTAAASDDDTVLQLGGKAYAGQDGVPEAFANCLDLVRSPNVDVVAVTLPTNLHAEIAVAALQAGKHVISEKPMGLSVAECDRMLAAEAASGRTLIVDQCVRFFPQYELIKEWVDSGRLGRIRYASLTRLSSPPTHSKDNWMLNSRLSGGAIFDLHIHDVDFAQQLMGVPDTIRAHGSSGTSGGTDHVFATYGYADGRYALVEGGWGLHLPWPFDMSIVVHGEKGTLSWTASKGPDVQHYDGAAEVHNLKCANEGGTRRLIHYFVDAIRAGQPVTRCTAESARLSMALAALEKQAVESGETIDVAAALGAAVAH